MKTETKNVTEVGTNEMCAACGHHEFCKFEEKSGEILGQIPERLKGIDLGPFMFAIQCQGFCKVAESPSPEE